jgi:hypothetical protein
MHSGHDKPKGLFDRIYVFQLMEQSALLNKEMYLLSFILV